MFFARKQNTHTQLYTRTLPVMYDQENLHDKEGILSMTGTLPKDFYYDIFNGRFSVNEGGVGLFNPIDKKEDFKRLATAGDELVYSEELQGDGRVLADTSEVIIPLVRPGYNIYGHWLLDLIPKINFFQQVFPGQKYKLLIYKQTPEWTLDILKNLGVTDEIFRIDQGEVIAGLFFLMSPIRQHDYITGAAHIGGLLKVLDTKPPLMGERVYLSRKKMSTGHRQFYNSDKVEALFKKRGFKVVYPEQLSLSQQIELFSGVSVLAGEAGSALHNNIFCRPGTVIINLQSGRQNHFIQSSLCSLYGQTPIYVFGKPESTDWGAGFHISIDTCKKVLDSIG